MLHIWAQRFAAVRLLLFLGYWLTKVGIVRVRQ